MAIISKILYINSKEYLYELINNSNEELLTHFKTFMDRSDNYNRGCDCEKETLNLLVENEYKRLSTDSESIGILEKYFNCEVKFT